MEKRKSRYIGTTINGLEILDSQRINGYTKYKVKCVVCGKVQWKTNVGSGIAKCKCQYNYGSENVWCYIDGRSKEKLYSVYSRMRGATTNPNNNQYIDYGGRGIKVCDEWLNDYQTFKKWAYENGYKEGLSIDRINNDGNYEPSNCRWVTNKEQSKNRRTTRLITCDGKTQCAKDWAKELKISYPTFMYKIRKGETIEQIVNWNIRRK